MRNLSFPHTKQDDALFKVVDEVTWPLPLVVRSKGKELYMSFRVANSLFIMLIRQAYNVMC